MTEDPQKNWRSCHRGGQDAAKKRGLYFFGGFLTIVHTGPRRLSSSLPFREYLQRQGCLVALVQQKSDLAEEDSWVPQRLCSALRPHEEWSWGKQHLALCSGGLGVCLWGALPLSYGMHISGEILKAHNKETSVFIFRYDVSFHWVPLENWDHVSFEFCEIIRNSVVLNGVSCLVFFQVAAERSIWEAMELGSRSPEQWARDLGNPQFWKVSTSLGQKEWYGRVLQESFSWNTWKVALWFLMWRSLE